MSTSVCVCMCVCMYSGNHQLEVAQLSIKVRELTSELEEARVMYSHQVLPGTSSEDHDEEHIYEDPPPEEDEPLYDTVEDLQDGRPLTSLENKPAKARR